LQIVVMSHPQATLFTPFLCW